jgi:hypothetical protein
LAPALLAASLLFSASVASAHPAWGIVADADGRVYFSDLEGVWRLAPSAPASPRRPRSAC